MDPSTAFRRLDESPAEFLAREAQSAIDVAKTIDASIARDWEARAKEIAGGVIATAYTWKWLETLVDYWGPKDRDFAAYLQKLRDTYRIPSK